MKEKKYHRLIALLLMLAMILQLLPIGVIAEDGEGASAPVPEVLHVAESAEKHVTVIGELSDRRSEAEKHFRLSDGSFAAVDYGVPVHYTADEGETWEDIRRWIMRMKTVSG